MTVRRQTARRPVTRKPVSETVPEIAEGVARKQATLMEIADLGVRLEAIADAATRFHNRLLAGGIGPQMAEAMVGDWWQAYWGIDGGGPEAEPLELA